MGKSLKVTVVTTCTKKKLATPWASFRNGKTTAKRRQDNG